MTGDQTSLMMCTELDAIGPCMGDNGEVVREPCGRGSCCAMTAFPACCQTTNKNALAPAAWLLNHKLMHTLADQGHLYHNTIFSQYLHCICTDVRFCAQCCHLVNWRIPFLASMGPRPIKSRWRYMAEIQHGS